MNTSVGRAPPATSGPLARAACSSASWRGRPRPADHGPPGVGGAPLAAPGVWRPHKLTVTRCQREANRARRSISIWPSRTRVPNMVSWQLPDWYPGRSARRTPLVVRAGQRHPQGRPAELNPGGTAVLEGPDLAPGVEQDNVFAPSRTPVSSPSQRSSAGITTCHVSSRASMIASYPASPASLSTRRRPSWRRSPHPPPRHRPTAIARTARRARPRRPRREVSTGRPSAAGRPGARPLPDRVPGERDAPPGAAVGVDGQVAQQQPGQSSPLPWAAVASCLAGCGSSGAAGPGSWR